MGFNLRQRAARHADELNELSSASPSRAFRDIGRHADRGSANLTDQTETFVRGPGCRTPINPFDPVDRQVPNIEFAMGLHQPRLAHVVSFTPLPEPLANHESRLTRD